MAESLLSERCTHAHPLFRVELAQAAFNHGYRRENGLADGWLWFRSDEGVPGEVALASGTRPDGAPWFMAVEHAGVARHLLAELGAAAVDPPPAHFRAAFAFTTRAELGAALSRAYRLAVSLPTFPLSQYAAQVAGLGETERDAMVRQRVGQDCFRKALMDYWGSCCPLTGIREPALLRASHIVPWAQCTSDEDRLDVFNGLLLAAHWDAAFDRGLISFADDGSALLKPGLDPAVVALLAPGTVRPLPLDPQHAARLAWHRRQFGFV